MRLETSFIDTYINDGNLTSSKFYSFLEDFQQPDPKRKDVVQELMMRLTTLIHNFPTFHPELWQMLFHEQRVDLKRIIILPIIGTRQHCLVVKQEHVYIMIDLIVLADTTPIVSQMEYLLTSYLHLELARFCIHRSFPFTSSLYEETLNYLTFSEGLANFIAWNSSAYLYKFHETKYDPYKEMAFGRLAAALEATSPVMKQKFLMLTSSDYLWDQFTTAAGMFYYYDVFIASGYPGVTKLYQSGWEQFIDRIFL